jgi:uncharacterized damage-inducible protein DinB
MRPTLRTVTLALAVVVTASPLLAHDEAAAGGGALMDDVLANLGRTGNQLVALAEATPAEHFGWAPTPEVRTVSEVYMHIVGTNLLLPSALGLTPPEGVEAGEAGPFALMQEWEKTVTDKEAVIARLRESFAYLATALPQIRDLDAEVSLFGPPASKRSYVLIILAHAHEHLGQSIAYARSVGVVPPWSQTAATEGEPGAEEEVE